MKQVELVFIPTPALSHIMATVATAKLLVKRAEEHHRLSATLLIMNPAKDATIDTFINQNSSSSSNSHLRLIKVPPPEGPPNPSVTFVFEYIETQAPQVRQMILNLTKQHPDCDLAGVVLDLFTTNFIDVAHDLGLSSYAFSPCGACYLGTCLHLDTIKFEHDESELSVPYFSVPVPTKVLPGRNFPEDPVIKSVVKFLTRLPEVKGILANTFYDLEPHAMDVLMSERDGPRIYPVGPVLASSGDARDDDDVKKWLDEQPEKSVVFLCFGSMGSLVEAQVREFALALENSGFRFLWSMRDGGATLPGGFLERTEGVGKVIGWAAQAAVLAHKAVGGFVSHCGWNSILESVWFGVPIAAFPLYAEQHLNAFEMVEEVGVAEAITLDYHMDFTGERPPVIAGAEVVEAAIRRVMEGERGKVEEMQRKGRDALEEGGSSYKALSLFIEDLLTFNNA